MDLREQAARLRERQGPARENRPPPEDTGKRLATLKRDFKGRRSELRVSWAEYEGRPFLSLRQWNADDNGGWWPDAKVGCTVRVRELADFAEGVAAALDIAGRER